jgi:hypothetical protein
MKPWESKIPKTPKQKHIKRCYTVWREILGKSWAGGKVVWLTDKELTFYTIKNPTYRFDIVLEKDKIEYFKQYIHQTVD